MAASFSSLRGIIVACALVQLGGQAVRGQSEGSSGPPLLEGRSLDTLRARERANLPLGRCRQQAVELNAAAGQLRARIDVFLQQLVSAPAEDRRIADSLFIRDGQGPALFEALQAFASLAGTIVAAEPGDRTVVGRSSLAETSRTAEEWRGWLFTNMPKAAVYKSLSQERENIRTTEDRCMRRLLDTCGR
jgi:hypothetical protein